MCLTRPLPHPRKQHTRRPASSRPLRRAERPAPDRRAREAHIIAVAAGHHVVCVSRGRKPDGPRSPDSPHGEDSRSSPTGWGIGTPKTGAGVDPDSLFPFRIRSSQLRSTAGTETATSIERRRAPGRQHDQRPRAARTPSPVDQCSCMALHSACPVQPSNAAHLDTRNASVWARPCPGAPPSCPTQKLSRSPQTVPINTGTADQTCWSAACAYARRHEKRPYLVAGVLSVIEPPGPPLGQRCR
jgi:hypothetical protein